MEICNRIAKGEDTLPGLSKTEAALCWSILEELDCSHSLAITILCRNGQIRDALELPLDPSSFEDPDLFARSWQAKRLLSKSDTLDAGFDRRRVAQQAFASAEARCAVINRKFRRTDPFGRSGKILSLARKMIRSLLPALEVERLGFILSLSQWGSGSTSSCKGRYTGRTNKIASTDDRTPELFSVVGDSKEFHLCPIGDVKIVPGNTVSYVPKSYKTHRAIAVEPTLNSALQRGFGIYLRRLLLNWKIDLRNQSTNQELARRGSVNGLFATLDLSMASDTISIEIVRYLLPPEWFYALNIVRSHRYVTTSGVRHYNKFSSMGCGFTFELETLIFSSIVKACNSLYGRGFPWSVYGDDIVCDRIIAPYVSGALRASGFVVNHEKSFIRGPFRESCGEEFFYGVRCTPYYLRGFKNHSIACMTLANHMRSGNSCFLSKKLWLMCYLSVPKRDRLIGPSSLDGVFHVNEWEVPPGSVSNPVGDACVYPRPFGTVYGYRCKTLTWLPAKRRLSGRAGQLESNLRIEEYRDPWDYSRYDFARESGRWVRKPSITDRWPMVLGL